MPATATMSDKELLRRLVRFDTTSARGNLPIVDCVCDYLERPGVRLIRQPSADATKANVIAMMGPETGDDRAGLALSGHLDVVPPDAQGWSADPFTLTESNGRLIARGACDMKGSVALAMNVLVNTLEHELKRPLALLLTYDEEVGSLGAARLADGATDLSPLPRSVLIGEPTSLKAVRMHKGHLKLRVTVTGKAAHSGLPHLGVNAIETAADVLDALRDLKSQLEHEVVDTSRYFPEVPYVAINIGRIAGGGAINVVPDRCVIDLGVRTLPGMDSTPIVERVRAAIASCVGVCPISMDVLNDSPPMLLDEDAPIHQTLCDIIKQRESLGVSFSTDAGVLSARLGMECVIFGPGRMEDAHRADESLPLDQFERARLVVAELVRRMCVE